MYRQFKTLWRKYPLVRASYNTYVNLSDSKQVKTRKQVAADSKSLIDRFRITEDDGYALWEKPPFEEVPAMVAEAQATFDSWQKSADWGDARKSFLNSKLLDTTTLTLDSPFMQFALKPEILAGVAAYLGYAPILQNASIWYSRKVENDLEKSQLYHLDIEDFRQLKIFILASEVTPESGPFTFLPASKSQVIQKQEHYTNRQERLQDQQVHQHEPMENEIQFVGQPGTMAAVDTSRCLHYGSRVQDDSGRLLIMFQYIRPYVFKGDIKDNFAHLRAEKGLSPLQQLALRGAV